MSSFFTNKHHLREVLLFCFNLKKNAVVSLSRPICGDWFKRFKRGNFDKERSGRPNTIEDANLQTLLDGNDT